MHGFSLNVREVLEHFDFDHTVWRLDDSDLLYRTVTEFLSMDLGPDLSANEMGLVFEELVRRFAEQTSEAAGEFVTPRDVGQLLSALLTEPDLGELTVPGVVRTVHDPVCGTGGLLGEAANHINDINPEALFLLFGQELNSESWAIARSGMLMSGHDPERMAFGNVLREDGFPDAQFDYLVAHPPFGVSWDGVREAVRAEHEERGPAGRFGAGLPRVSDGSLLFLQHMLAKVKPVDASGLGGSRIAVLFSGSPMFAGPAGSGESEIRRWIVENDWLEGIVALPDHLFYSTGIGTYAWVLSNRKSTDRQGHVILVKAQDCWEKMRLSIGGKRKYLGPDQLTEIVQLYREALSAPLSRTRPQRDRVRVVRNEELLYRQIVIERPLRLRFELTQEALGRLAALRPVQRVDDPEALLSALQGLVGTAWNTKSEAFAALRSAAEAASQTWPSGAAFEKSVRNATGVRDDGGELQRRRSTTEPDPELRDMVSVPLSDDPEAYFRTEVLPRTPDAWVDHSRTRMGCTIPSSLFYLAELDGPFEPLRNFVRLETDRVKLSRPEREEDAPSVPLKHLTAPNLHGVGSSLELPDAELTDSELTLCSGGDLVGRFGNWRLLPAGFGDAVTPLFVLHPLRGRGRGLCEWLNSRKGNGAFPQARDLLDTPVPVELVTDTKVDELLEEIQEGRRALRTATESILPNVFASSESLSDEIRNTIRFAAHEARLAGQLARPFDDPIWRAESSYPFHVAALARRYRVSTHPAERKDGLLKLGEGTARTLGILALSELIAHHQGFTRPFRQQFRNGATFGTWLWLIERFLADVATPRLPELAAIRDLDATQAFLEDIKDFRNHSHHAHGVRMSHEIGEDVEKLEPRVVSAISSVNWLSGLQWYWVERCEYLDEASFQTIGLRLRGSHPSWEPFERSTTYPLRPDRIYVDGTPPGRPVDLWPLAMASLCPECRTRELFLLNQIRDDQIVLRSLEEHSLVIPYPTSQEA